MDLLIGVPTEFPPTISETSNAQYVTRQEAMSAITGEQVEYLYPRFTGTRTSIFVFLRNLPDLVSCLLGH